MTLTSFQSLSTNLILSYLVILNESHLLNLSDPFLLEPNHVVIKLKW